MPNIPKPELEQGCYIAYSNEPDTVVDNAGGGGAVYLELDYDSSQLDPYTPTFTFNDVKNAIEAGNSVYARSVHSEEGYNYTEIYPILTLSDNGDDSYVVATNDYTFVATGPDVTMSIGII